MQRWAWSSKAKRAVLLACGLLVGSCAARQAVSSPAPSTEAFTCRGGAIDADQPLPGCVVPRLSLEPPAEALRIRVRGALPTIRSGGVTSFDLEMQNVSGRMLAFDVGDSLGAFHTEAFNATFATFQTECGGLGIGGLGTRATVVRVHLDPDGTVRKRVWLSATMARIVVKEEKCVAEQLGALPPGNYTLRVQLPWSDPTPGAPNSRTMRFFDAPLVVLR